MLVIGFANKFYTLWEKSDRYIYEADTFRQSRVDYTYLQNLSFDFDSAVEKVKNQTESYMVDLDLKGSSSFTYEGKLEYKDDIFLFGKYKKQKFSEVNDDDYKLWYYSKTKDDDEKYSKVLVEELIAHALLLQLSDGSIIPQDELLKNISAIFTEDVYKLGHYGEEKERITDTYFVRNTYSYESTYGIVQVIELVDRNKNLWYVRGSYKSDEPIERGQFVEITGTIAHKSWYDRRMGDDRNETQLKRPKVSVTNVD